MTRFVTEFTFPAEATGMDGIKYEDGGQAAILYGPQNEVVLEPSDQGPDEGMFVRLQSWVEGTRGVSREQVSRRHTTFNAFMGKRVRVTVETID